MKLIYSVKTVSSAVIFSALMAASSLGLAADAKLIGEKQVSSMEAPINLNTADASTLAMLNGVGDKKAADIIAYRDANGKFSKVDDLLNVKGIGQKTLEKNRSKLSVN